MSSLTDFKRPVWQGADAIARHWLEALRVARVAPAGEDVEGPLPGSILLVLDEHMNPRVGNAAWGYMLSRYDAPYGPRTYIYSR